jgi:hypothetical protein
VHLPAIAPDLEKSLITTQWLYANRAPGFVPAGESFDTWSPCLQRSPKTAATALEAVKESYATAVNDAVRIGARQLNQQLDGRFAELQKHEAQIQERSAQIERSFEQTRQQTDTQTNHVLRALIDLRLNSLAKLHDTETELLKLKNPQVAGTYEALKDKLRKDSARLSDPDAH